MLPEPAGVPGVGGAPRICGCTREPTMHPGAVGAAGGLVGAPGVSRCSRRQRVQPANAPRVDERSRGQRPLPKTRSHAPPPGQAAPGGTGRHGGLPEAGRVLQTLLEIHRHLHLASAWPRRRRRRSRGSCGSGRAEAPGIRAASASARPPLALRGAAEGAAHPGHSSRGDCNGSAGPGRLFLRPS